MAKYSCDLCGTPDSAEKFYVDKVDFAEKVLCFKCVKFAEYLYTEVLEDRVEMENHQMDLLMSEERVCGIPEDAWDAISSVVNSMESGLLASFLRLRGHEEKALAVEGAHRGLLRTIDKL